MTAMTSFSPVSAVLSISSEDIPVPKAASLHTWERWHSVLCKKDTPGMRYQGGPPHIHAPLPLPPCWTAVCFTTGTHIMNFYKHQSTKEPWKINPKNKPYRPDDHRNSVKDENVGTRLIRDTNNTTLKNDP